MLGHKFAAMAAFVNSVQAGSVPAEPSAIVESGNGAACVVQVAK